MSTDPHAHDETIRQAYRAAAQAEPGPQLDAKILQAAHAAVKTPARKPTRWSWLTLPLATAAVAVLVTTLVLQSRQAPPPQETAATSAPPQTSQPTAAPPGVVAQAAKPTPDLNIAAAQSAKKTEERMAAAKASDARQDRQRMQIAAAEDAANMQRRSENAARTDAAEAPRQKTQDLKIAAAEPATPAPAPVAAKPFADVPAAVAAIPAPAAAIRQETPSDKLAEAERPLVRERKLETFGTLAKTRGAEQPTDRQIEEIRKLQREGKRDAAKKALAELRKKFPLYKVPEDLRALIEPAPKEN